MYGMYYHVACGQPENGGHAPTGQNPVNLSLYSACECLVWPIVLHWCLSLHLHGLDLEYFLLEACVDDVYCFCLFSILHVFNPPPFHVP
jgi:hypothetical protein